MPSVLMWCGVEQFKGWTIGHYVPGSMLDEPVHIID